MSAAGAYGNQGMKNIIPIIITFGDEVDSHVKIITSCEGFVQLSHFHPRETLDFQLPHRLTP